MQLDCILKIASILMRSIQSDLKFRNNIWPTGIVEKRFVSLVAFIEN